MKSSKLKSKEEFKKELSKLTRLMEETESLSLSGGWEWNILSEKLTWTHGIYKIHDISTEDSFSPKDAINFYLPTDREIIKKAFEKAIQDGEGYDLILTIKSYLGKIKTIRTTGIVRKTNGKISHVFGSITDVTLFTESLKEIDNKNTFINGVLSGVPDVIIAINEKGNIIEVNIACKSVFGFSRDELINKNISKLIPLNKRAQHQSYLDTYSNKNVDEVIGRHRNLNIIHANGETIRVEVTLNKIIQQGKPVFIAVIRDIEKELLAKERINALAFKDRVTKLPNYQSFEKSYQKLLMNPGQKIEKTYFIRIDFEKFFKINFAFGHKFGNQVLCYIAGLLKTLAKQSNASVYRISGISFIMVFSHTKDTHTIVKEIKENILNLFLVEHSISSNHFKLIPIITIFYENNLNLKKEGAEVLTLLESCRQNQDKKINITIIDELYLSKVNRELQVEELLKQAIGLNIGLYLVYQPQFDHIGSIHSAEALIRMKDDKLGTIYPDEFIKIAERTGLIIPLTKWIITTCLTDIKKLVKAGIEIPISINISAYHIVQSSFVSDILSQINKFNVSPELLMLELTESAFADDIEAASINMSSLNNENIKFSLDDFGTGYSNLGYLNQLPFDELKIDKIFIDNICVNQESIELLEIIISIGKVKKMKVVAEGVETLEQVTLLKNYGIDLFQGYYFSQPVEFNTLNNMLNN